MFRNYYFLIIIFLSMATLSSCETSRNKKGDDLQIYAMSTSEADWIRNGEPIEFGEVKWYPKDGFEVMTDSEVYMIGKYRDVPFFVDKGDIRPYERLYTRFDRHTFRSFERKHDKRHD